MSTFSQKVEFSTSMYVLAHGHSPRGRGGWAFYFGNDETPWFAAGSKTYTEARKEATREAQYRNVSRVVVGS